MCCCSIKLYGFLRRIDWSTFMDVSKAYGALIFRQICTRLHDVIFHKKLLCIVTALKTSCLTVTYGSRFHKLSHTSFNIILSPMQGCGDVTTNCYKLNGLGSEPWWMQGIFTFSIPIQTGLGAHPSPVGVVVALFSEGTAARPWLSPHSTSSA